MTVQIRPLVPQDIVQVAGIETQAFPTLFPPTNFKGELENRIAKYLVAWETELELSVTRQTPDTEPYLLADGSLLGRIIGAVKGRLGSNRALKDTGNSIVGFVGLWFIVGEAHITAIAVEEASRGKGIGELLIIGSLELAMERRATVVTLEARVSNHVAQSLYQKYGFENVGIRKAYYTDNREDAVIMTTQPINTIAYREKFRSLREAYQLGHGEIKLDLGARTLGPRVDRA